MTSVSKEGERERESLVRVQRSERIESKSF